jgi:glucokinase
VSEQNLYFAGVDFGGTAAKVGIVDDRGNLRQRHRIEIEPQHSYEQVFSAVSAQIEGMARAQRVQLSAIGVGSPGFIDREEGRVLQGSENLPAFKGRSLVGFLASAFDLPTFADNDANCAAAGELKFGAGRSYRHFVMLTLGAGVGGAIVIDGRVHRGSRGLAGELGHMCLDPGGPWCTCGSRGCLEQYASAPALVGAYARKRAKREPPSPSGQSSAAAAFTPQHIFEEASRGDAAATETIEEVARRIAQALGTLVNLLDTQACIIGGGMSAAGQALLAPVRRHLPDYAWPLPLQGVKLHAADLQNDAGILGAAAQAWERLEA